MAEIRSCKGEKLLVHNLHKATGSLSFRNVRHSFIYADLVSWRQSAVGIRGFLALGNGALRPVIARILTRRIQP